MSQVSLVTADRAAPKAVEQPRSRINLAVVICALVVLVGVIAAVRHTPASAQSDGAAIEVTGP